MIGCFRKRFRVESVLKGFGRSVFFTLTTPYKVDYFEIRQMWRNFRNLVQQDLRRQQKPKLRYVQCFEPHPNGHGWHIHMVIDCKFVDINFLRHFSRIAGFGRINIEAVRCAEDLVGYVAKYMIKASDRRQSVETAFKSRVRLLNVSRGLSRLSDIVSECLTDDAIREIVETGVVDDVPQFQRWEVVRRYLLFDILLYFYCRPKSYQRLMTDSRCKVIRQEFITKANQTYPKI